jgi:quercetin dioxygenase-like cupin family protein
MSASEAQRTLTMPNGSSFTIIESTAESAGARIELEATLPPQTNGPPRHFHPQQHESWHVIDGELTLTIDGRHQTLSSGQTTTIEPGTVHTFSNRTSAPVRFRDVHTPALDFQEYMETLSRLTVAGKLGDRARLATLINGSMVLRHHRTTQVSASAAQRAAESFLARVGQILGYTVDQV